MSVIRRSNVQVQVLSLYKACLRAAQDKPSFKETIRSDFRKNATIPKSDVLIIEHLMRQGQRKLSMIRDPNVQGIGSFIKEKPKPKA